ncbi:hypothetical protein Q8W71_28885 [Methylobacterium sp. NEAU 140]|uniref:hypothetical protein n=1 Tax=Methylobacterium sp. NEAU 140 TaxID=3064945 RepID=UPI00273269F0|nr:hypothetical protein [Methylobacterium sp. NEAU 140]MDP4026629.1 hypothetical protein [Methylobacterium sp. NEAU 140]
MPNRPDDPYDRFPLKAAIGLTLMIVGGVALLFLSSTWQDWRQAALGALILFALIGLTLAFRRLKPVPAPDRRTTGIPLPEPAAASDPRAFDPVGFIEAAKRRQPASQPQQIEEGRQREARGGQGPPARTAGSAETIRRLQDLRDHPATPEPERQAADEKVKKLRSKRRSAWSKRP